MFVLSRIDLGNLFQFVGPAVLKDPAGKVLFLVNGTNSLDSSQVEREFHTFGSLTIISFKQFGTSPCTHLCTIMKVYVGFFVLLVANGGS